MQYESRVRGTLSGKGLNEDQGREDLYWKSGNQDVQYKESPLEAY